jgi:hypothetical protein
VEATDAGLDGGIAVRISALCLIDDGRLGDRPLWGTAVRGGLLLDLARSGRVESTDDSIVIDERPTGFEPADRLLAAIGVEPERSLDEWLDERRIGLRDLAAANVASGRWTLRRGPLGLGRRYTDLARAQAVADLARKPDADAAGWAAADACVTAVAAAAGLLSRATGYSLPPSDAVIAASGSVAWLCSAVVDHLRLEAGRTVAAGPLTPF